MQYKPFIPLTPGPCPRNTGDRGELIHACGFAALLVVGLLFPSRVFAQDKPAREPATSEEKRVEELSAQMRKSLAIIVFTGRDGKQQGMGTGFVIDANGLIATNMHVLGEARPISVQMGDGKRYPVVSVHASDRNRDLAVLRIDAKNLTPLPLGDSDALKAGQTILAFGHPQGLEYSVVRGVLSGRRDMEGKSMLQLAIPIEQGNSGGPVLDLAGKVHGVVTMKSLVTANLGFAVPINELKPLLEKPNTITMSRWLTIGALDPSEWKPLFGGAWRQRAGRIVAESMGVGFGGRTICLYQQPTPKTPFEVAVTVKLADEAGAAGLVFHADGGEKHYGFYPSAGKLRLTRFNGPDVFSWTILKNFPSDHYRAGDWNTIKVRVEKDKLLCYVNDALVEESDDVGLKEGAVGLSSFRGTEAQFKNFEVAKKIASRTVSEKVASEINKTIDGLSFKAFPTKVIEKFTSNGQASLDLLRARAQVLEEQAAKLRDLAVQVHQQKVIGELGKVLGQPDSKADLLRAALLIANLDNEEIDVAGYVGDVDRLARQAAAAFPKKADEKAKLLALNNLLFNELGFHGSRVDYYTRNNSYLNEVIDDREGLPITLSVLYMETASRVGLKVVGVGMPGHFMVRHEPKKGEAVLVDVYDGGKLLSRADADKISQNISGESLKDEDLAAFTKKKIIVRMLHNLLNVAERERDADSVLRYLDAIVSVAPENAEERWARAVFRFRKGLNEGALEDANWLLDNAPKGINLEPVRELHRVVTEMK